MKRAGLLVVTAGVVLLALAPARAQFAIPGIDLHGDSTVPPEVQEKREEIDRAYRINKGSLPEQQGATDPWANMRSPDEGKPAAAAKPAAKRTAKPATASTQKKPAAQQ
jgi:hypothetical protein